MIRSDFLTRKFIIWVEVEQFSGMYLHYVDVVNK